jgi:hypothetical protein
MGYVSDPRCGRNEAKSMPQSFPYLSYPMFKTQADFHTSLLGTVGFTGIFAVASFLCALPRTFDSLSWMSIPSVLCILVAGIVGMVGAGLHHGEHSEAFEGQPYEIDAARSSDFYTAFFSITVRTSRSRPSRIYVLTLCRTLYSHTADTSCQCHFPDLA